MSNHCTRLSSCLLHPAMVRRCGRIQHEYFTLSLLAQKSVVVNLMLARPRRNSATYHEPKRPHQVSRDSAGKADTCIFKASWNPAGPDSTSLLTNLTTSRMAHFVLFLLGWTIRVRILAGTKYLSLFQERPHRLWGSTSLPFNSYRGLSLSLSLSLSGV